MPREIFFAVGLGVVFLLSSAFYKFVPQSREGTRKIRREMVLAELLSGVYCLVVALLAELFRFRYELVVYLAVGGSVLIGFVVLLPKIIRNTRDEINRRNNQE